MEIIDEILKDYTELCREKMVSIFPNYTPKENKDPIYDLEKYAFRRILPKKRILYISSLLKTIPSDFQEPFHDICKDIREGNDLHKYQSRLLNKAHKNDGMLGDWGIQHLHLSNIQEKDGYVQRTNELLFVRFTDENAYLIGIFEHGEWVNTKIIEIIHNQWPSSIESYIMHGISPSEDKISIEQRNKIRKVGANTAIQMDDGTVYMGPGLGLVNSGAPAYAIMKADSYIFKLKEYFTTIQNQIDAIEPKKNKFDKLRIGMFIHNEDEILFKVKETGRVIRIEE